MPGTTPQTILAEAQATAEWMIALRRRLHWHPELAYEEFQTSALVCRTLDELKIPYRTGFAVMTRTAGTWHVMQRKVS